MTAKPRAVGHVEPIAMGRPPRHSPIRSVRSAYLAAILRADAVEAQQVVDAAISSGTSVAAIYLRVLTPVMYGLGVLWERAQVTVADEHIATAITQGVIARLAGRLPSTGGGPRPLAVAVGCGPGDFHGLGSRMVADFLQAAGWRVLDLGAACPASAFVDAAVAHGAGVVAVSTSRAEHLDGVLTVRHALDDLARPPVMAVGGLAYRGHPERAARVGADLHASDPTALLTQLEAVPGLRDER